MDDKLKNLLKNCLKAMKDYDGDITELQKDFDDAVKRSAEHSKNLEFEVQYSATPFTDKELLEILGEEDFYACRLETLDEENCYTYQLETLNEEIPPVSYNEKDKWEIINFKDNDYARVA